MNMLSVFFQEFLIELLVAFAIMSLGSIYKNRYTIGDYLSRWREHMQPHADRIDTAITPYKPAMQLLWLGYIYASFLFMVFAGGIIFSLTYLAGNNFNAASIKGGYFVAAGIYFFYLFKRIK